MLLACCCFPLSLCRVTSARNQEVVFGKKHVPPLNQCMIRNGKLQPIVKSVAFLQALPNLWRCGCQHFRTQFSRYVKRSAKKKQDFWQAVQASNLWLSPVLVHIPFLSVINRLNHTCSVSNNCRPNDPKSVNVLWKSCGNVSPMHSIFPGVHPDDLSLQCRRKSRHWGRRVHKVLFHNVLDLKYLIDWGLGRGSATQNWNWQKKSFSKPYTSG